MPAGRLESVARARYGIVVLDDSGARGFFKGVCVWVDYRGADVEGGAGEGVVAVDVPDVSAPIEVFRRARRPDRPVGSRSFQEQAVVLARPPMPDVRGARARSEYRKLCAASRPPRPERLVRRDGVQKLRRFDAHVDFHVGDFHPYFASRVARARELQNQNVAPRPVQAEPQVSVALPVRLGVRGVRIGFEPLARARGEFEKTVSVRQSERFYRDFQLAAAAAGAGFHFPFGIFYGVSPVVEGAAHIVVQVRQRAGVEGERVELEADFPVFNIV